VAPFDGGGGGRSSRLYRALVDRGLATEVGSGLTPSTDPTLLRIAATVRSGVDPTTVETAVNAEIARLQDKPVPPAELAKVKRQAQAQFVYLNDGVFRRAVALGAFASVDRHETLYALVEGVARVSAADVVRAAHTCLVDRHRTVGWYIPEDGARSEVAA
jgi:zinc protease